MLRNVNSLKEQPLADSEQENGGIRPIQPQETDFLPITSMSLKTVIPQSFQIIDQSGTMRPNQENPANPSPLQLRLLTSRNLSQ